MSSSMSTEDENDLLPLPQELVDKLIKYATKSTRLLFVQQPEIWSDFEFETTNKDAIKYVDYTAHQFCDIFVEKVLPSIYKCDLTEEEVRIFRMLELHPEFEAIFDMGYQRVPRTLRVAYCREPKAPSDYQLMDESDDAFLLAENVVSSDEFQVDLAQPPNTFAIPPRLHRHQGYGQNFQFDPQNAALLSAALSNAYELYENALLEPKVLKKRLISAKRNFENKAAMPENYLEVSKLLQLVNRSQNLRTAISDLMMNKLS